MTPVELLHEADRILDELGWCDSGPEGDDGEVCVLIALNLAAKRRFIQWRRPYVEALNALHAERGELYPEAISTSHFNDNVAGSVRDIKRLTKGARVRLGGDS